MTDPGPAEPEIVVVDDADAIATAATDRVIAAARDAIAARGVAHLAMTGGSSSAALYVQLRSAERRDALDWSRLHLWWGDDRYVPLDHPDSNAGQALRLLFDPGYLQLMEAGQKLPIPDDQVHPFPVNEAIGERLGPEWAAEEYARRLEASMPHERDRPRFDLVLLGVGPDGHILSVFPGSPALSSEGPVALAVPAPEHVEPHVERVTLHPSFLDVADRILVMVPGAGKARIVADVLGSREPDRWPAQRAVRANATWLLDRSSAANLG